MWSHQALDLPPPIEDFDSRSPTLHASSSESGCSDLQLETKTHSTLKEDITLQQNVKDIEAGCDDDDVLPSYKKGYWLRYAVFSVYRRLFSLVFLGNLAAFVYVMVKDEKLQNVVNAAVANLLALGLARQPLVVNALFLIFGSIPRSAPFFLRRLFAKIYCYGGIHSGCGVAAFVWYVGFIGLLTQQYAFQTSNSAIHVTPAIMTLSYIILVLLLAIIVAAYPNIRMRLHDYFELTHRFCGWAVVAMFWPLLILFSISGAHAANQSLGRFLITFPTFWMVTITTLSIIHPWILLRRVPIDAERISTHAIRLHLSHTTINFGQGISLSKHPLRDWHSFATFPDTPSLPGTSGTTKSSPNFSCLISKAGDWTSDTIASPPKYLYKRAVPIYGFGYVMKVFRRMILVTTGSGIGPCLSYLGDPDRPAMRVIWQTRTPLQTYGQPIIDLVKQLDPDPKIIDTSTTGKRKDMLPMVLKMAKEFDAEAVCVISNPFMTKKLVLECESRGVYAFGPIFDS